MSLTLCHSMGFIDMDIEINNIYSYNQSVPLKWHLFLWNNQLVEMFFLKMHTITHKLLYFLTCTWLEYLIRIWITIFHWCSQAYCGAVSYSRRTAIKALFLYFNLWISARLGNHHVLSNLYSFLFVYLLQI